VNVSRALLTVLAPAALGGGALPAAAPGARDENVLITAVTDDPCCGSGTLAFAVGVSGRAADGERSYFIPFMIAGQAKPRVGELCALRWRWWKSNRWHWLLADGAPIWEGREISDFSCRKPEPKP